jgi:hypothetical protein
MSKPAALRAAGWMTVGVVAASGVGVAAAATDGSGKPATATTAAATTTTPTTTTPATTAPAKDTAGKHAKHRKALLGAFSARVLHGQATVLGKDGKPVVVAEQRGTVDAVSPTAITLTSKDGFKQTYVVTTDTHVRIDGKKSAIGSVKPGDTAGVVAKVDGSTQTASLVVERAAKTPKPANG